MYFVMFWVHLKFWIAIRIMAYELLEYWHLPQFSLLHSSYVPVLYHMTAATETSEICSKAEVWLSIPHLHAGLGREGLASHMFIPHASPSIPMQSSHPVTASWDRVLFPNALTSQVNSSRT